MIVPRDGIRSLEKYARAILISCRKTHVRLTRARAKTITIKPRDVGTDQEDGQLMKRNPVYTLEEAIIVGLEILNRGKVTYADEINALGLPWTEDLKYEKGELKCALSEDEIDRLTSRSCTCRNTSIIIGSTHKRERRSHEWGWTLPCWRRVMEIGTPQKYILFWEVIGVQKQLSRLVCLCI